MKALVLEAKGAPPVIREQPDPTGEAVVRLEASALNHRDLWIQAGQYPGIRYPIVLGSDGTGVVESGPAEWVGRSVLLYPGFDWGDDERFQRPDYRILGLPDQGCFAERIAVPASSLVERPSHLDAESAAALPLAGVTAWRALMTRGQLAAGERVLVTGAGGGVASLAVQLAAAAGAEVWVTSSQTAKIDFAKTLGASGGALYTEEAWHKGLGAFDLIIDGAGGEGFGTLARLLAPGGRLVFYGGTRGKWPPILPQHLFFKQVSICASTMGSPKEFTALVDFVGRHGLRPLVARSFALEAGAEAFDYLRGGTQQGKVVLRNP